MSVRAPCCLSQFEGIIRCPLLRLYMSDEKKPVFPSERMGLNDWPDSEFSGKKAVLLYVNGSVVYTWFDMDINTVLQSPTPPELILKFSNEQLEHWPEISERFIDALDHGLEGRLIEVVANGNEFDFTQVIATEIDPEINEERE